MPVVMVSPWSFNQVDKDAIKVAIRSANSTVWHDAASMLDRPHEQENSSHFGRAAIMKAFARLKKARSKPDGIELTVITDMTSDIRHWRMLRNREFDCAELSMSNYLMAKYTGLPFVAIPVFLHRRFRHGFVFLNASKGITKPSDLIGAKSACAIFKRRLIYGFAAFWNMNIAVPHRSFNGSNKTTKKSTGRRRRI